MRIARLAGPALALTLALGLSGCQKAEQDITPNETPDASGDIAAQPTSMPEGRFAPSNDCIGLPGAKSFFLALETAVTDRDADALLSITDARVKLDFGGSAALQAFRERLGDKDSGLWTEIERLTALGCAQAANGEMVMPSYAAQDMQGVDPAKSLIVTGADVPVRQTANNDAPALAQVSWDAVTLTGGLDPKAAFQKVRTAARKEGFVASDQLRSPLAYRLRAARVGEDWRIVSFVRGADRPSSGASTS